MRRSQLGVAHRWRSRHSRHLAPAIGFAVVAALGVAGCEDSTSPGRLIGEWGAESLRFVATDSGADFTSACASGAVLGPISVNSNGWFQHEGELTEWGGAPGSPVLLRPATFQGRIASERLTLDRRGRQGLGPFELQRGVLEKPIIRRHDQPDSLYIALGRQYATLAHMNLPTPQDAADGEGTLIGAQWVLTAAHVATELKPGHRITVGGTEHAVDSIIPHPEWSEGPHDLALLRLARPVEGIRPAHLYRDSSELDRVMVLVGYGDFGTGLKGPEGNDHQVRGATNRVDEATVFWLKLAFDPPSSPRSTALEGVSGPGDSGGPAFLQGAPSETLVGVSSGHPCRRGAGSIRRR